MHQCSQCLVTSHGMRACTRSDNPTQQRWKDDGSKRSGKSINFSCLKKSMVLSRGYSRAVAGCLSSPCNIQNPTFLALLHGDRIGHCCVNDSTSSHLSLFFFRQDPRHAARTVSAHPSSMNFLHEALWIGRWSCTSQGSRPSHDED